MSVLTIKDVKQLREWLAYKIAPWVYVPYREEREEAFRDLAEVAYGSRDAIWTSPSTLVRVALREYTFHPLGETDRSNSA